LSRGLSLANRALQRAAPAAERPSVERLVEESGVVDATTRSRERDLCRLAPTIASCRSAAELGCCVWGRRGAVRLVRTLL
jgi:hypothetical protein